MKFLVMSAPWILVGLLLSGCAAGPVQLTETAPVVVLTSDKPVDSVAKCIDGKWKDKVVLGGFNVADMKTTDDGIRITQRSGDNLHYAALVSARPSGSKTQVWIQKVTGVAKLNDIALCQ